MIEALQNQAESWNIYNLDKGIQEGISPYRDSLSGFLQSLQSTGGDIQAQKTDNFEGTYINRRERCLSIDHTPTCDYPCNSNSTWFRTHKDSHHSTHCGRAVLYKLVDKFWNCTQLYKAFTITRAVTSTLCKSTSTMGQAAGIWVANLFIVTRLTLWAR